MTAQRPIDAIRIQNRDKRLADYQDRCISYQLEIMALKNALSALADKSQRLINNHWSEDHGQRDVAEAWAACDQASAALKGAE